MKLMTLISLYLNLLIIGIVTSYDIEVSFFDRGYELLKLNTKDNVSVYEPSISNIKYRLDSSGYVEGKILEFKSETNFIDKVKYYHNINYEWLLVINSSDEFNQAEKYIIQPNENPIKVNNEVYNYEIQGIFYNENINELKYFKNIKGDIPFFKYASSFLEILKSYSIENEQENIFTAIKISKAYISFQNNICLYVTIGLVIISIILMIVQYYLTKRHNPIDQEINKLINWLYTLYIFNSLVFMYCLIGNDDQDSNTGKYYSYTILSAIESIYKSLLWFDLILLSYGFKSYYNNFSRADIRWLIFLFIIVYLVFSMDFIISNLTSKVLFLNITIVDLKIFMVNFCLSAYCIYLIIKGLKKINVIFLFR